MEMPFEIQLNFKPLEDTTFVRKWQTQLTITSTSKNQIENLYLIYAFC